jgi:AraC family transcriptional regulator
MTGAKILGVVFPTDGHCDPFRYAIGVEKPEGMDAVGFEVHHIPSATWAVFECTAETESETISRVYSEWFPSTGYEHEEKPNIEAYFADNMKGPQPSNLRCQYWVPVIKKKRK